MHHHSPGEALGKADGLGATVAMVTSYSTWSHSPQCGAIRRALSPSEDTAGSFIVSVRHEFEGKVEDNHDDWGCRKHERIAVGLELLITAKPKQRISDASLPTLNNLC